MDQFLSQFLEQHRLADSFRATATDYYAPLAERINKQLGAKTFLLGINGTQGSGKSTLADFICQYLETEHNKNVVSLSIDDIYLTRREREHLSQAVHPLLQTRGVPGTHDVDLGMQIIQSLKTLGEGEKRAIPRFDKAADDRCPRSQWDTAVGPVDLIIFEGWCVGSEAEEMAALDQPVNLLEREEDPFGRWRQYINRQLAESYPKLFDALDALVLLKAPSFECVYDWRLEQEQKLALSLAAVTGNDVSGIMSEDEIARFIQHYERITRNNLRVLPARADALFELDAERKIQSVIYRTI